MISYIYSSPNGVLFVIKVVHNGNGTISFRDIEDFICEIYQLISLGKKITVFEAKNGINSEIDYDFSSASAALTIAEKVRKSANEVLRTQNIFPCQ